MFQKEMTCLPQDLEAIRILNDFLPDKIFDAHAHMFDTALMPSRSDRERVICGGAEYIRDMRQLLGDSREIRLNMIGYPVGALACDPELLARSDAFLCEQLDRNPGFTGEIIVTPEDTEESIEKRLVRDNIRGMKCYHVLAGTADTWNASIGEFLPEAAWAVANRRKLCITLHMVRDRARADEENLKYIREMAKKYPDAVLILAHAAGI